MTRQGDAKWFESKRSDLATQHSGRWLVVHQGKLEKVFSDEEEAVEYAINTYGIDVASVFHAVPQDPYMYIGA